MTKEHLKGILINAIDNGVLDDELAKIGNLGEFRWISDSPISFTVLVKQGRKFGQKEPNPLIDVTDPDCF